jgi:hypothetical protein
MPIDDSAQNPVDEPGARLPAVFTRNLNRFVDRDPGRNISGIEALENANLQNSAINDCDAIDRKFRRALLDLSHDVIAAGTDAGEKSGCIGKGGFRNSAR